MVKDVPPTATLFDIKERTRLRPAGHAESSYVFFNESARSECGHIRELLESWFAGYPAVRRNELRTLLQSTNEPDFVGAFFELYCYTLLSRQGFTPEIHPSLNNERKTHPDFRVRKDDVPVCYFECTVARGRDPETERRINLLLDDLNQLRSANFLLCLDVHGDVPKTNPPIKEIRRGLDKWLHSLDHDAVAAKMKRRNGMPTEEHIFRRDGWHLVFAAVPLREDLRGVVGTDRRLIGSSMYVGTSSFVDAQQPLLKTLSDKRAGRYGELDLPYVIAVSVRSEPAEEWDIRSALFGHFAVSRSENSGDLTLIHQRDGFWMGRSGPQNRSVSAVLVTSLLEPFRCAIAQPVLWHNPWARRILNPELWSGPQIQLDLINEEMYRDLIRCDGQPAHKLLELDSDWPFVVGNSRGCAR